MANVYTVAVFSAPGVTNTRSKSPPAGFVWVIIAIDSYFNLAFAATTRATHNLGPTFWVNNWSATAGPQYASWRGRHVVGPGETVDINSSQPADICVTAYQLLLP